MQQTIQQTESKGQAALRIVVDNVAPAVLFVGIAAATMRWALSQLDPNKDAKRAGKARGEALSRRMGRKIELLDLEQVIGCRRSGGHLVRLTPYEEAHMSAEHIMDWLDPAARSVTDCHNLLMHLTA